MIELLITIGVMSTGLFAAATLVFSNLQLSDRDADSVVAMNLAREGIEEAKQLRDSNWLAGKAFDDGLVGGSADYSAIPRWDGGVVSPDISFDFTPNTIGDATTLVHRSLNLLTPVFFTQTDANAPTTPWHRLLVFHPICQTGAGLTYLNDGSICDPDSKIGIRVESRIQWRRKNQTFTRVMYDDLFDWR